MRVTAPDCHLRSQKGTLISIENDLFSATLGDENIECPVEALTRLDVLVGERKWWKAGLVGAGIVAVTGTVVAISVGTPEGDNSLAVLISTSVLTPVGFLVGSLVRRDRWGKVPLPLLQPSLRAEADGRLGFGFSIPLGR